jgi:hypothetical protein
MVGKQSGPGEIAMEGIAKDVIQKVIDGMIVDKMPERIESEKSPIKKDQKMINEVNENLIEQLIVLNKQFNKFDADFGCFFDGISHNGCVESCTETILMRTNISLLRNNIFRLYQIMRVLD